MRVIEGHHADWKCLDQTPHASLLDDSKMKDSVDTPTLKEATADESPVRLSLLTG